MAYFTTLYSGSSGNCALIRSEDKYLLIDMGKSCRTTLTALKSLGLAVSDCVGILVTHEHSDHVKGLAVLLRRDPTAVYALPAVCAALRKLLPERTDCLHEIAPGEPFCLGDVRVTPFPTPHDAAGSCGYRLDGSARFGFCTDLGTVTDAVRAALCGVDCAVIEANHDPELLRTGPYPIYLKRRIASDHGHLSNESAGALAVSAARVQRSQLTRQKLPMMAVGGAFVFAAQMINFTIPGTGSSGHIGGGILLAALLGGGPRTLNELEDKGISRAVLDNLCAKGVLECSKVNKSIDLYSSIPLKNEPITLTQEQQAAYDALLPKLEDDAPHSALLYGVTGSGKTLVFLKLIARCLEQGRRALVLVPEISLTPQMILRLKSQFGRRVAVQHSALNHTERLLQWQMIQDGGADIVVGTRSAIFSPLENIGLIIIDEEQEHTYRSESAPRYSAHEVARQRAAENGALLLLASATPSTESFYAAQHGRTQLVRLTQRYGGNPLPKVQIVDMRAELASGNPREISLAMEDAIRRNLDAGKQTILLLNRRGYQTMAQCEDCREVLKCTKCSVPMVYHKAAHKVLCHYCGSQMKPPTVCPACGGKLQYRGFGTQKAEEELAKLFPDARVLRMDQDSTAAKDAHEKLLARFANHEYDIMVGTQMVAKGLDFEDVTLVGVLGIDSLLFAQGFRAYENVFSLITQVVGRSGRARDPGFAIIQTTDPDNPVLNLAAAQDYDAFFEQEIAYRKLGLYPPFCGLCVIGFAGAKEIEVARAAARFAALLGQQAAKQPDLPLRVLGPTPGSIEKINDTYRYKLTIKCRNDRRFRDLVRSTLERYEQEKLPSKATVAVDLHSDGDI